MNAIDENIKKMIQQKLGYDDKETGIFFQNPKNIELLSKINDLKDKLIVLEVVESKGCNSNHKAGDKFYFDFAGNILTEMCPKRVCAYSLNSALMMVFSANEMLFAGLDPNAMKFKRASCFDVGIECGGWGKIVLELKVEERKK